MYTTQKAVWNKILVAMAVKQLFRNALIVSCHGVQDDNPITFSVFSILHFGMNLLNRPIHVKHERIHYCCKVHSSTILHVFV